MLLSAPIRNIWWAQGPCAYPIFSTLFRCVHTQLRSSSPGQEQVSASCYIDGECKDFLPWLEDKAGMKISSVLSVGKSAYGRSLCASKPIRVGDCILQVPYSVQLAPNNLPSEILSSLGADISNVAKVALLILYESKLGQNSEWAPYIGRLPPYEEMHSSILWSDEELEMIRPSALYQETNKQKMHIEKQFLAIKSAFNLFAEVFGDVTLEDFKYAYTLVTSRAWESSRGVSMIPFADFLNHDGNSDAYVMSDEGQKVSEVIAARDYAPGEQVFIKYGKFSNATLLLDFGFTLRHNIYDEVQVELNMLHDDPLSAMKLELLHRHRTPTLKNVNEFSSSENCFTIKEVKSSTGKGRGIPQSLRAFSRVLFSSSAQELSDLALEAAQNDGRLARRPLKDRRREVVAHQFIFSTMTQLIEERCACIESLLLPTCGYMFGKCLPVRRSLALDLLAGERRVLESASTWLKNYYTNLSGP